MNRARRIAALRAGRSSVRAAIARLNYYIVSNRTYYAVWSVITLGYVGTFLAVPMLTGRTVGAIEQGESADVIVRMAICLAAVGG